MARDVDTIAAIATPVGRGGIGVIRISGQDSEKILQRLFQPRKENAFPLESHRLYFGRLIAPESGRVLDEVLATIMRAPHSYTGEDVAEIHCHGSPLLLERILDEILRGETRLAGPGEFTRRAFLNNRINLAQAEAVLDLIEGKTERGIEIALDHLQGTLSDRIQYLRYQLVEALALVETAIDFSDEDLVSDPAINIPDILDHCTEAISGLLSTYREGKIRRDGLSLVITGKPNVGKSSLLNRLLGEDRAIVSVLPGTTRDFIEETFAVRGLPVRLIDTAGIRKGKDEIEEEGIRRVWEKTASADGIIILIDGSVDLSPEDGLIIEKNKGKRVIIAINKIDLPRKLDEEALRTLIPDAAFLPISAKFGNGLPELKEAIYGIASLEDTRDGTGDRILTNLRHKEALVKTLRCLERGKEAFWEGRPPELVALDLRDGLATLGEITGETTTEEVLDHIFSRFCIGK